MEMGRVISFIKIAGIIILTLLGALIAAATIVGIVINPDPSMGSKEILMFLMLFIVAASQASFGFVYLSKYSRRKNEKETGHV